MLYGTKIGKEWQYLVNHPKEMKERIEEQDASEFRQLKNLVGKEMELASEPKNIENEAAPQKIKYPSKYKGRLAAMQRIMENVAKSKAKVEEAMAGEVARRNYTSEPTLETAAPD